MRSPRSVSTVECIDEIACRCIGFMKDVAFAANLHADYRRSSSPSGKWTRRLTDYCGSTTPRVRVDEPSPQRLQVHSGSRSGGTQDSRGAGAYPHSRSKTSAAVYPRARTSSERLVTGERAIDRGWASGYPSVVGLWSPTVAIFARRTLPGRGCIFTIDLPTAARMARSLAAFQQGQGLLRGTVSPTSSAPRMTTRLARPDTATIRGAGALRSVQDRGQRSGASRSRPHARCHFLARLCGPVGEIARGERGQPPSLLPE